MNIHAFDFDGTLTNCDTLPLFIHHVRGKWALVWGLLLYGPLLVMMKLHLLDNGRMKEQLFRHFFCNMDECDFNACCESFAQQHKDIFRKEGLWTICQALNNGDRVCVISASIDNWVIPCIREGLKQAGCQAQDAGKVTVIGTQIEIVNGRLTGRFCTPNCYGSEKVRRLKAFLSPLTPHLIAYGDSRGDQELLNYADEAHYRPFRESSPNSQCSTLSIHIPTLLKSEIVRFAIVGVTAVAVQYGTYLLLLPWLHPTIANTIGYAASFLFNYIASVRYTFRVSFTMRRGAGFAFAHLINFTLQTLLLTFFLWQGLPKALAMLPVFFVCVPVNFLLVRFFLKGSGNH